MSKENVEIIRGAYKDFNAGKIPEVLALLDPEVQWTEPGGGKAPAGTFRGPESVGADVFATVPANFDEFEAGAQDFRDDGDTVTVTGLFKGKAKSGAALDARFTHVWEMRDGKAVTFNNDVDMKGWTQAWS
jgi:ketosteroid isomerase-like protein